MRKISRKEIEKKVRKEYKLARKFCQGDRRSYYKMMIDVGDGDIWSDVFISTNDWKQYKSSTIMQLSADGYYVKEIEREYIEDAIRELKEAGWEITE